MIGRSLVPLVVLAVASSACAVASESTSPGAGIPEVSLRSTTEATTTTDPMVEPEASETTVTPTTTTDPSSVTAPYPIGEAGAAVIYLLAHDPTATGPSPSLIPVARPLAILSSPVTDLPRTTLGFLLAGPTPGEREGTPSLSTEIPDGTELLDLTVADRIATVDLSAEFEAGAGTYSEIARLEQLVYTLTRFDEIDGIRLEIEGEPVSVFGGHGIVLSDPVVRTDLDTSLPAILIESPAHWGVGTPGTLVVGGTANVFEATVSLALVDADGLILWEGFTTATCGTGCRGDWTITVPYDVAEPQLGAVIAWEESARDGSQVNIREHPVFLFPADET